MTFYDLYDQLPVNRLRKLALKLQDEGQSPMAFVCIATGRRPEDYKAVPGIRLHEKCGRGDMFIFDVPTPPLPYLWYEPKYYSTPQGLQFELDIIKALAHVIKMLHPPCRDITSWLSQISVKEI